MNSPTRRPRFSSVSRTDGRVMPLELFFDLVFVLAITQCTSMMADDPTWPGIGRGLLVLSVLWWAWVGYAWLTSVVDPEEGIVRIVIIVAMTAFLLASIAGPGAFDGRGLLFAISVGIVRTAHIALFLLASRGADRLRHSVLGLAVSTALGVGLLVVAAEVHGTAKIAIWIVAVVLDIGGPLVAGQDGWQLEPAHFAERHGLIVLIALGESIVALGAGTDETLTASVVAAVVLGVVLAATMWWAYFDVVAIIAGRNLAELPKGLVQNGVARDAYSYLHLPMVAGVVLSAFGLKQVLHHAGSHLATEAAVGLAGGVALYLLAHVSFKWRNIRSLSRPRLAVAVALVLAVPLMTRLSAVTSLGVIAVTMVGLIVYETVVFADARDSIRHSDL